MSKHPIELLDEQKKEILQQNVKLKIIDITNNDDKVLLEYIMVLLSNKKTPQMIKDDLSPFLMGSTDSFVDWLWAKMEQLKKQENQPKHDKKKEYKERDKDKEREKPRERDRERERDKGRERERERDRERDRERERDRDRDREREKPRERKELDSKDRPTSTDKPNDSFRYDDFTIEETTVVENPTLSYKESLKRTRDEHSPISNKSRRTGLPAPNSRREEYEMPLRHQDKPDDVVFTVKLSSSMLDPKDTQKKSFPSKPARPPRAPNGRYKNLSLVLYNPTSSPDKPEAKPSVATTKAPKPPPKSRSSAPNTKPNAKPPTTSQTKKDEKSLPPKRLARPIKKAYIEPSPVTWISKSLSVDSPLPDLTVSRNGNMVWRPEDVIAKHQENKV